MTEAGNRARILAHFAVGMNIATAIGPPVGMVIVNRFGFIPLFLVCTAVSLCTLLMLGTLSDNPKVVPESSIAGDGFLFSRTVLPPSIIGFIAIFIWGALNTFYPLHARSLGVANPGLFFTAMATMLILTRTFGGPILDIKNRKVVIGSCIIFTITALVILYLSGTQLMFIVAALLWGTGHGFLFPSLLALALERSGSSPALVVATVYAFADGGLFLGPLAMGVVAQYVSYSAVFLSLSILSLMGLLYLAYFTRRTA
jgi:predicted MFS family arabinose efflux permease